MTKNESIDHDSNPHGSYTHVPDKYTQTRKRKIARMRHKLMCQDCGGAGGYIEVILDDGTAPWFECGWCLGVGHVLPEERAAWLRYKKDVKHGNYGDDY